MSLQEQGNRAPFALLPLLRALGDLKRIYSAGRVGSTAERLFVEAWSRLVAGEQESDVAFHIVSQSLIAVNLGDLDAPLLEAAGLPPDDVATIFQNAVDAVTDQVDPALRTRLLHDIAMPTAQAAAPPFVARLAAQPRAGATSPGRNRLILEPSENHAEHCLLVAVYGVLLAPAWGARPEDVFLAGLAHHLHNATLPDSGYAGEVLLGKWLQPVMASATSAALQELSAAVRLRVETAMQSVRDATSAESCAFNAADTLDRVLQLKHHLRAANTTMQYVLQEMQLVHAGPIKPFQDAVLARMGLAS